MGASASVAAPQRPPSARFNSIFYVIVIFGVFPARDDLPIWRGRLGTSALGL